MAAANTYPVPLQVITQKNEGRFLARWAGSQKASRKNLLLLDSRVLIGHDSLRFLKESSAKHPEILVWNGHVDVDTTAPLVGHFWQVPTYVFWSEYLANPRPMTITLDNFDRVPKGTGFLYLPASLFREACVNAWPSNNAHLVSDDTKILRFVAGHSPIRIDPHFWATYRPRSQVSEFLTHGNNRGTLFVDSYAGTGMVRNSLLILLGVVPPVTVTTLFLLAIAGIWNAFVVIVVLGILALLVPAVVAVLRRCPCKAVLSYLIFIVPFGGVFWAGLIRGLWVHRASFAAQHVQKDQVQG